MRNYCRLNRKQLELIKSVIDEVFFNMNCSGTTNWYRI